MKVFHFLLIDHPITIDQCYINVNATTCAASPSNIHITDVLFQNVTGSGSKKAGQNVATIICSAEAPCDNFTFKDVDLVPYDLSLKPVYQCRNLLNNATAGIDCTAA